MTLMVMTLVMTMSTTIAVVTINNLQGSWRARQSGAALSAADAGIAQAVSYLRSSGVGDLGCSPTCVGNPWGNESSPSVVALAGGTGQRYKAWIEKVAPFPQHNPGRYRIHSTGLADGSAARPVVADVSITSTSSGVPKGIFARSITGGGSASVTRQSIFSTGCVYRRSKIAMVKGEIDAGYGIPVGVHSSQYITDANGSGQYCGSKKTIHDSSTACNKSFPYDQDLLGGRLVSGDGCYDAKMAGAGEWAKYFSTYDVNGDGIKDVSSLLKTDADMFAMFGFQPTLNQGYLDTLRLLAKAQGNYYTSASGWSSPTTASNEVVMFFDLTKTNPGGVVDLKGLDSARFGRAPILTAGASCPSKSLTIVIEGGNAKMNGNAQIAATLILTSKAPHGQVQKANGTAKFIGTIYADTIDMTGNVDLSLDACFLANGGPAQTDIAVTSYREEDRGLS